MTRNEFLEAVRIEMSYLGAANAVYPAPVLVENYRELKRLHSAVEQMSDRVFSTFWRVMGDRYSYLIENIMYDVPFEYQDK